MRKGRLSNNWWRIISSSVSYTTGIGLSKNLNNKLKIKKLKN
jgi:hypothetical protein